jgi:hypothetical protein
MVHARTLRQMPSSHATFVLPSNEIKASKEETHTLATVESPPGETQAANASRHVYLPSAGKNANEGPISL